MTIKIRPLPGGLRRAFPVAVPLLMSVLTAQAQTTEPAAGQTVQRVEITGSNIRRSQAETASPVQTVNRADIEKSGKTTVAELLQTLAVDNSGSVPTSFGSGFAAGASGISLRGLGAQSTLVLLNGRRIAPYGLADDGQKTFADLNIIPAEAVERVEILKDGASAIYGSDAIAGVVNVILRRDYVGTTVRASQGLSNEKDGADTRIAVTHGVGDLETDRYNFLFSAEYGKKKEVWNRDRADRGAVGKSDLRDFGFSAQEALGGTGAIVNSGSAGSSIIGNVQQPGGGYYSRDSLAAGNGFTRTFPGAKCSNLTSHPQGDPLGGCLIDSAQQYNQMQPRQETLNLFSRATFQLNPDWQAYVELNGYHSNSDSSSTPSGISGSVGYPGGPVNNATISLGAAHPDNPYFGSTARLRYLAYDVGPRTSNIESNFTRAVAGLKGSAAGWDIDSAILFSMNKVNNERGGYLQRDVAYALLNPSAANVAAAQASAAYRALPAGTYWRIGENAGLNSQALYDALSPTIANDATTKLALADFKASREFGQLPGGAIGIAVGAEVRHDSTELAPTAGTDRGNIIGLGYSAYEGQRNSVALYTEAIAPVLKTLEISGALRYDHFNDVGNSYTPKVGFKFTPINSFALRGTFARGFRAPGAAENGRGGLAAFTTAADPTRCALGVTAACSASSVAVITSPNPDLSPEKSKSFSLGAVWDPLPRTSISIDGWQIKRTNEINQESTLSAIAAGRVVRDIGSSTRPGDPGAIVAVLSNYVNSAATEVRGLDLDARTTFQIGSAGSITADAKWTHLFKYQRIEQNGDSVDFAGTHGNCDVTNCIGTPDDRVNLGLTWDRGPIRLSGIVNFRGKLDNKYEKEDTECAFTFANGNDAPNGCKISSFTTLDLTGRYKVSDKAELFGTIQNVFDKEPPLDPLTYGAAGYNPLDYSGALGRYFQIGMRYTF
ncbi:iron complex outermembrane receptor protein [Pseudoduganella lurida]|uniref:Iron complex outermembrane receptor protein n=1 Tax=Pseudoduganella lurida TaxID=1036180 RepID=A0A562RAU2_9BURK|nr:TonB-dependent receptor [Pseudoduganella lurida]TWI65496.1 iron complex outermembrane receptor protein [Pseudoduganella lurida]